MKRINYNELTIDGLHYVREVPNKEGERGGYLLIDNKNKPVISVYKYLRYRQKKYGDAINSLKRTTYDLAYFFDFMLVNNITVELIDYEYLYEFVDNYLRKIDPNFKVMDVIDRTMMKRLPMLSMYNEDGKRKVKELDYNKIGGLTSDSINRILNKVKMYLIYLNKRENIEIDIDNIFVQKIINVDTNQHLLGHIYKNKKIIYSVNGILKAVGVPIRQSSKINPIEPGRVFEEHELEKIFGELQKDSNIMYYLFFYLLLKTGMRISEARAIKIWQVPKISLELNFDKLESDINLINRDECKWEVCIKINPNNPKDLQIKGNKPRRIPFLDLDKTFESLFKQALIYRNFIMKKKKKKHEYLFVNRNGDRFLNPRTEQKFSETLRKAGLSERLGGEQLVVHSFRHTYASNWVKNLSINNFDVELNYLSKILGHSNSDITRKTYIHFLKKDLGNTLIEMDRYSRINNIRE